MRYRGRGTDALYGLSLFVFLLILSKQSGDPEVEKSVTAGELLPVASPVLERVRLWGVAGGE
jgi:hypothetical protein